MIDTKALRSRVLDLAIRGKLTEQLPSDGTAEELYQQILEALKWIRSRLQDNSDLPQVFGAPEPEQYASFTLDELASFSYNSGIQIDVIYIDTLGVWSFRISEPDPGANLGTEQERPAVNGRTFTTEIAFRKQADCVGIGVRTICSEPSDNNVDCEVFRPRVVKALIDNPNLHLMQGGSVIDGTPLEIRSKNDFELFFDIFLDEARSMPIIIAADSKTETVKMVDIECTLVDINPGIGSYSLSGLARQNDPMKLTISADLKDYKTNIIPESRTKKQKAKPSADPKYMYIDHLFRESPNTIILDTQYRMTDQIGNMISELFYDGILKNGRNDKTQHCLFWVNYTKTQDWPPKTELHSDKPHIYNYDECRIISELFSKLNNETPHAKIAVIAPYRAQAFELRKRCPKSTNVKIDTVDGFQGKESDIVIFSITRTIGVQRFLADVRRINVALSRAKNRIYIVGELNYCNSNRIMKEIIKRSEIIDTNFNV